MSRSLRIPWASGEVSGRIAGKGSTGVLLAHGAGTDQDHPFMTELRDQLANFDLKVMTFNYPYTERGVKRPDRLERLVECHRAAADFLSERVESLFLGGRSMGGRMGTYLAASEYPCDGLILYSYPLHPPGRPEKLRIEQFPDIKAPMLFFQGTRDALSRQDLFDVHIRPLPNATVVVLEGASHSTRGGGWTPDGMATFLAEHTAAWVEGLSSGGTSGQRP